jgi:hypothetical protein
MARDALLLFQPRNRRPAQASDWKRLNFQGMGDKRTKPCPLSSARGFDRALLSGGMQPDVDRWLSRLP